MTCPFCGESEDRHMIDKVVNGKGEVTGFFCNVCASLFKEDDWPHCKRCDASQVSCISRTYTLERDNLTETDSGFHCEVCGHDFWMSTLPKSAMQ
jgi:hypothetical protein